MQWPKLTPLQSRLAACIGTSLLLLIVYSTLSPGQFAYAAELDATLQRDHNHPRIDLGLAGDVDWGDEIEREQEKVLQEEALKGLYEPEFGVGALGRELIGRAAEDITPLKNNVPVSLNLQPGQTVYYVFENSEIFGPSGNSGSGILGSLPPKFGSLQRRNVAKRSLDLDDLDRLEESPADQTGSQFPVLDKRQNATKTANVYITANTCLQPSMNGSSSSAAPQLALYLSSVNQKPGPGASDTLPPIAFNEGYATTTQEASGNGNLYIGVSAPNITGATGEWNFQISTSIDNNFFRAVNEATGAFLVDTDSTSTLIVSDNLTDSDALANNSGLRQQWESTPPPFKMFIVPANTSGLDGVRNSFCGLSNLAANSAGISVNNSIITRNQGNVPKQQFMVEGLSLGTQYWAFMSYSAANGSANVVSGAVNGGGIVWQPFSFKTKSDGNCKIIHDLPFCSNVAYAVPSGASSSLQDLVSFYDDNAKNLYQNFSYSLQQVACNTTSSAMYSLSRNCTDCDSDYRTWLCAVTIPRCADFQMAPPESPFLLPRNIGQNYPNGTSPDLSKVNLQENNMTSPWFATSRYPPIDHVIKPGPYRELLPCIELCYELVKSCPASMQFSCPSQDALRARSYGSLDDPSAQSLLACNRLGVDQPQRAGATRLEYQTKVMMMTVALVVIMSLML
ncbi:hypothetical protein BT63DRAFT_477199 [Microthyrium microscopicum]|uniref:FZ domain-containing protein n=1 Tax=Microthyrium microscopicum TaxID=703497 RepID=A0A6A6UJN9_9PEZI|nr:hypothetical protein BT63DRAFT_477199 [Microthyrium microscopicum]